MPKPASLATIFDELEVTKGDEEFQAWLRRFFSCKDRLGACVATYRAQGKVAEYVGYLQGSFNFSFRYKFSDGGPDAIIRFPKPGPTATVLRDEKVANEVQVMDFLRQKTTIPVPRVHGWGVTADSPQQLGPFVIMDFVEGVHLTDVLMRPPETKDERIILDPDIDSAVLMKIYRQIAGYLLQLSQLPFDRIGAISRHHDTWSVTKRPLTYNMNELATVAGYPCDRFPQSTFSRTSDYLESLSREHIAHFRVQRNLASTPEAAQARLVARRRFSQLIPDYCINDAGPFLLFCDDLRPSNMLVHPDALEITAVLDLEFTNAMPAQFAYDPPWWLLLSGPEQWLERSSIEEFRKQYEPRMEQFLQVLEHLEAATTLRGKATVGQPLSARMRDSWKGGSFWFNYAARRSFDIDAVYWAALHIDSSDLDLPASNSPSEVRLVTNEKMEQLRLYKEDCATRFAKKG